MAIPPALRNLGRSRQGKQVLAIIAAVVTLLYFLSGSGATGSYKAKVGGWTSANIPKANIGSGPPVVLVTVIDPKADPAWTQKIKRNREEYAKRHGMVPQLLNFQCLKDLA
jgi:mannan polymerase II complex MNN11 subunit